MIKQVQRFAFSMLALFVLASPALAQVEAEEGGAGAPAASAAGGSAVTFSGAFGVGLTVIGAAYGIGRLAGSALESMARQPEVAGNIQTAMIIAAALIEGFTFYALFICSTQNPWPAG